MLPEEEELEAILIMALVGLCVDVRRRPGGLVVHRHGRRLRVQIEDAREPERWDLRELAKLAR